MKEFKRSVLLLLVLTLTVGILYPLGVTGIAKIFFSRQSQGNPIFENSQIVGFENIGQNFDDPRYLWGRLSATTPFYNAAASSGSHLGPSNEVLIENIKKRIAALKSADPHNHQPIPIDLVTSSGSGLDPHISLAAADYQVGRIASANGASEEEIRHILLKNTEGRTFGILGEPRVNVLAVNLALRKMYAIK